MRKFILCILMMLCLSVNNSNAQTVKRNGNTFTQVDTKENAKTKDTKSNYTFEDKKGNKYPIYISKNGKAYILRTSKKSGKQYKQYLPEITAQLSKK